MQLAEKHLKCSTPDETRWKDAVSHFVLRLAYCRCAMLLPRHACMSALHAEGTVLHGMSPVAEGDVTRLHSLYL